MSTNAVIGWIVAAIVIIGGAYLFITWNGASDASMMHNDAEKSGSEQMMASSSDSLSGESSSGDAMMKDTGSVGDKMMATGSAEMMH